MFGASLGSELDAKISAIILVIAAALGVWVGASLGTDPIWLRVMSGLLALGITFLLLRILYALMIIAWLKIKK
jgi:preprotein translocase subunit SecD